MPIGKHDKEQLSQSNSFHFQEKPNLEKKLKVLTYAATAYESKQTEPNNDCLYLRYRQTCLV